MRKLDEVIHNLDARVEQTVAPAWKVLQKYFVVFSATLLTLLFVIFLFRIFHNRSYVLSSVITEDLANIEKILNQIDKECNIIDIRSERAFIDFLTVEKFTGSVVGCLNVAYPKRWKGPYLRVNPTIQEKLYEIVKTKEGYFVLPGQGVRLPNKLVVGKDFVIAPDSVISTMLKSGGRLNFKGEALGFQLTFKTGDWGAEKLEPDTIESVNKILKEFNEAMPYAQRPASGEDTKNC